ncbi:MAG: hypothetical protein OHK0013_47160 [Sandaracinaceae bacterium]
MPRRTRPDPVSQQRFFVPLCVFIFGMGTILHFGGGHLAATSAGTSEVAVRRGGAEV